MKVLTVLITGGALTMGLAMAQDAPKPASSTAPATQTKAKKHRKHHKKAAKAAPAPSTTAPKN